MRISTRPWCSSATHSASLRASRLRAEQHSLLVYGKGQFFLPDQDSEKHDEMVATLVASLPSVHGGGQLVIDDGGTERTYRGSCSSACLPLMIEAGAGAIVNVSSEASRRAADGRAHRRHHAGLGEV